MMYSLILNRLDLEAADAIAPQRCCAVLPCMRTVFGDTHSWDVIALASLQERFGHRNFKAD
jgi:hypothetical protein